MKNNLKINYNTKKTYRQRIKAKNKNGVKIKQVEN